MLKVNEKGILADYNSLVDKKEKGLSAVETDARAYAQAHGYDEEKTAKFVAFTQDIQGSGLSDKELAKLEALSAYIDEVEEPAEESVESEALPDTATNPVSPNATVNVL